jgi:hypothetical protein
MSTGVMEDGYTISRMLAGVLLGKLDVTDCNFVDDNTISLHLKDGSAFNVTVTRQAAADAPNSNTAKTMGDLVTPRQLVAIRAIANSVGVNAELECLEVLKCRPEELSRRAASAFIDLLKSKASGDQQSEQLPQVNADNGEAVTEKQLSAIYAIAKGKSLDAQLESAALFKREPEHLSRREASTLIDHLRSARVNEQA